MKKQLTLKEFAKLGNKSRYSKYTKEEISEQQKKAWKTRRKNAKNRVKKLSTVILN